MARDKQIIEFMPIPQKAEMWAEDLVESIRRNFKTQGVYPYTDRHLYYSPKRNRRGDSYYWKSTGASFDNLYATVVAASDSSAQIDLFYQKYLDFVDMGTGFMRPIGVVFRSNPYRHSSRYADTWSKTQPANTQRPILNIELYNTRKRMMRYMQYFYLDIAPVYIMHAMADEVEHN